MTAQPPTLSVILPAYNVADFVEETLRAVVAQGYRDWELLIMENASEDSTMEVLDRVLGELSDPRIRVLRNPSTLPAPESWNNAISQTRGEFIKLVCADDVPAPDSFARQVAAMRENPSVAVASGGKVIIDRFGRRLFNRRTISRAGVHPGKSIIRECIVTGTNIIGDPVHVMWRRAAMNLAGMFSTETLYATDVEFWFRLLEHGDLYWDLATIGYYRIHGKAFSAEKWRATVRYFMMVAHEQVARGVVSVSPFEMRFASWRAYAQGIVRECLYKIVG
jgi:glycosyltransferase involved in cell wall biosynthesis